MEHDTYEISSQTIRDIMDTIPQDKWEHVLTDMSAILKQAKAVMTVIEAAGQHLIDENVKASDLIQMSETITWVDDGKHENEINFVDENDKDIGGIKFGGEE